MVGQSKVGRFERRDTDQANLNAVVSRWTESFVVDVGDHHRYLIIISIGVFDIDLIVVCGGEGTWSFAGFIELQTEALKFDDILRIEIAGKDATV